MLNLSPTRSYIAVAAFCLASATGVFPQTPGNSELNGGYKALAAKDYDVAIAAFQQGLALQPGNAKAHKDLAYTLLKTGDNSEARDQFKRALDLDLKDETAALEFAFLAYETKQPIEARRAFDKLRHSPSPATSKTAGQAFENIDKPLADGIARWQEALRRAPDPNALSTSSRTRAIAVLVVAPSRLEVDGLPYAASGASIMLPSGQHLVTFVR